MFHECRVNDDKSKMHASNVSEFNYHCCSNLEDMDVEKLSEIILEGERTFCPLTPCKFGLMHIMNLHLLPLSNCTQQSVEVLSLYILTNLDLPNLVCYLEK